LFKLRFLALHKVRITAKGLSFLQILPTEAPSLTAIMIDFCIFNDAMISDFPLTRNSKKRKESGGALLTEEINIYENYVAHYIAGKPYVDTKSYQHLFLFVPGSMQASHSKNKLPNVPLLCDFPDLFYLWTKAVVQLNRAVTNKLSNPDYVMEHNVEQVVHTAMYEFAIRNYIVTSSADEKKPKDQSVRRSLRLQSLDI
jgi:hypothetical protein